MCVLACVQQREDLPFKKGQSKARQGDFRKGLDVVSSIRLRANINGERGRAKASAQPFGPRRPTPGNQWDQFPRSCFRALD